MDGFFVRGRDYPPLVPPASRTHKARPINDQPIGLGVHDAPGGVDPENVLPPKSYLLPISASVTFFRKNLQFQHFFDTFFKNNLQLTCSYSISFFILLPEHVDAFLNPKNASRDGRYKITLHRLNGQHRPSATVPAPHTDRCIPLTTPRVPHSTIAATWLSKYRPSLTGLKHN